MDETRDMDSQIEAGELPHLQEGVSELVTDESKYYDGGIAGYLRALREEEKIFAKEILMQPINDETRADIRWFMQKWFKYEHFLGGEHYGPVGAYAKTRIVALGDALEGRLPVGAGGLAKILSEEPERRELDADEKERYAEYIKGVDYK